MKKSTLYTLCLFTGIPAGLAGIILNINHFSYSDPVFQLGSIPLLIVAIMGLIDVATDNKLKWHERSMWITAFILLNPLSGLLYLPKYKRKHR